VRTFVILGALDTLRLVAEGICAWRAVLNELTIYVWTLESHRACITLSHSVRRESSTLTLSHSTTISIRTHISSRAWVAESISQIGIVTSRAGNNAIRVSCITTLTSRTGSACS
jgi:hypothetical protein